MKIAFFFLTGFFLISCSGKNDIPREIIQPKKMQTILWDVIRAQELSGAMARKDSAINEIAETKILNKKIYEIHNITSVDFERSYQWYTEHPEMMRTMFDSMTSQNQRQKEERTKQGYKPFKRDTLKKLRINE